MDFVIFFLGLGSVICGLYYLKKSNPNPPREHHA